MFGAFRDVAVQQLIKQAGTIILHHELCNLLFFLFLGKFAGKLRTVPNVLLRLFVFVDQHFQYAHIAIDLWFAGLSKQIADLGLMFLPIAVNTPVTLLEYHQRPRNIKVNHFVAKVMQVDPFRCHIRTNQKTQRRLRFTKGFYGFHQHRIALIAAQRGDLIIFQFQIRSQLLFEELQRFNAFGEDHQAIFRVIGFPGEVFTDGVEQQLVFAKLAGINVIQRQQQ
ncbi:Uncharacterised protein [Klebsiella pneumoniae]|nr:Uncharacterised protein [Klebsiella pneumoniae]SSI82133.1 Uncharacterised protein [Klebsiella pneumoniae]